MAMRVFEDYEATRSRVPLLIALVGPSGGGKTYSALRLATGIQRVTGGDIHVIDTESRRALHYADRFRFRHVPFGAPFGPADYLQAVEHCRKKGAGIAVIDSGSHEHEGPGGVLEMHDAETKRRAAAWKKSEDVVQMGAWGPAKAERRKMINAVLQLPITTIWCFRAKEKLKIIPGKQPQSRGWMPIAGEEFVYEMTVRCLLLPRADGVPTWQSKESGELETMKLPEQFRELFAERRPLSEDIGETMAKWAEGGSVSVYGTLLDEIDTAPDAAALEAIVPKIQAAQKARSINLTENDTLRSAYAKRKGGAPSRADRDAVRVEEIRQREAERAARFRVIHTAIDDAEKAKNYRLLDRLQYESERVEEDARTHGWDQAQIDKRSQLVVDDARASVAAQNDHDPETGEVGAPAGREPGDES